MTAKIKELEGENEDFMKIYSIFEELFLAYPTDEPFPRFFNKIHLLLQKSAIRLIVLRDPKKITSSKEGELHSFENLIVYCGLHREIGYNYFIEQLGKHEIPCIMNIPEKIKKSLVQIGQNEDVERPYFLCAIRRNYKNPEKYKIDICKENDPARQKLDQFFKFISRHDKSGKILLKIIALLDKIPDDPILLHVQKMYERKKFKELDTKVVENYFSQIYQNFEEIYNHIGDSPIVEVLSTNSIGKVDYKNIFFFVRSFTLDSKDRRKGKDYTLRVVIPDSEKKQIEEYYQRTNAKTCQWYKNGKCGVVDIEQCLFDKKEYQWDKIWDVISQAYGNKVSKTDSSFIGGGLNFNQHDVLDFINDKTRQYGNALSKEKMKTDELGDDKERDCLMACFTHRMVPCEHEQTQIMYIPIYVAGTPWAVVSFITNAYINTEIIQVSNWNRNLIFYNGLTRKTITARLQAHIKKSYLRQLEIILQTQHQKYWEDQTWDKWDEQKINNFIEDVNNKLFEIARIYPYKISSIKKSEKSSSRNMEETYNTEDNEFYLPAGNGRFEVHLEKNDNWPSFTEKEYIFPSDVAQIFMAVMEREVDRITRLAVYFSKYRPTTLN